MAAAKKKLKPLRVKKLSSLLAIGLRDLRKQERAKNSVVDMNEWYKCNGTCTTCLAGSVMRFSMGVGRTEANGIWQFELPDDACGQLSALNDLRSGGVYSAWKAWRGEWREDLRSLVRDVPRYDGPNGDWWKAMRKLLADLRKAGE